MSEPSANVSFARPAVDDCWNRIGAQGDGTCPELPSHVHCRNCPVYSASARRLLDGVTPTGYLAEWADHFAREKPVARKLTHSVIIFRLGAERFGLAVGAIKEVAEMRPVHSLPHRRNPIVTGIVNIRGELLVCVSMEEAFGLEKNLRQQQETNPTAHPYLLVISQEGQRLAFPVDEVAGLHRFGLDEVGKVPATVAGALSTCTQGILSWQDKTVGYLDESLLFRKLSGSLS